MVPAQGFAVDAMVATVGFLPISEKDKSHAVQDLEQQEDGGSIEDRAFIPMTQARGGSNNRNVLDQYRLKNIMSKIVDSEDSGASTPGGRFLQSARYAGLGGFVIGNKRTKKGARTLWQVVGLGGGANRSGVVLKPLYSVKAKREVTPADRFHDFMKTASILSAAKMQANFIAIAEARIARI